MVKAHLCNHADLKDYSFTLWLFVFDISDMSQRFPEFLSVVSIAALPGGILGAEASDAYKLKKECRFGRLRAVVETDPATAQKYPLHTQRVS